MVVVARIKLTLHINNDEMPRRYRPPYWSAHNAIHDLRQLDRVHMGVPRTTGIETASIEKEPDIAGHCDGRLAFDVWNCDSKRWSHLRHDMEREARGEGVSEIPLLELDMVFDSQDY